MNMLAVCAVLAMLSAAVLSAPAERQQAVPRAAAQVAAPGEPAARPSADPVSRPAGEASAEQEEDDMEAAEAIVFRPLFAYRRRQRQRQRARNNRNRSAYGGYYY
ncbi:uncharacterized protein LOC134535634 isoform X2 [Bacillus rossius redtenbacheri]|uniref:uncharacterized protein LOC134535634 isoform X2 n=1 Tax=Bacillus rossius redtenbacheri TaxID=93214 RepID=UPI002FDD32F9